MISDICSAGLTMAGKENASHHAPALLAISTTALACDSL